MDQYLTTIRDRIIQTINNIPIYSNSVIVYDIDKTLIDDYGNPIMPILDTYFYARSMGLIPMIITARYGTATNTENTKKQLQELNITYKSLYFLPIDKHNPEIYKREARKHIHDSGYRVEISVGDMYWDIGEYGGIGFLI